MMQTDEELEAFAEKAEKAAQGARLLSRADFRHIASILRACKGRVKVKPLEWEETQADRGDGTHEHDGGYEAETPFGPYAIDFDYLQGTWAAFGPGSGCLAQPSDDPNAAKAAAQADYEARILAALEQEHRHE